MKSKALFLYNDLSAAFETVQIVKYFLAVCWCFQTSVIEYVKPSDLKKDMNETFSEKFPHVQLTLSKIRRYRLSLTQLKNIHQLHYVLFSCTLTILSLKREIRKLAQEDCGYEEPTIAMAHVYFEKLALHGKLDKQNRKLCAGACILLAAKISNDLKKPEVKHLIDVSKALWY